MKDEAVINAWSLREVYFDEDGNPSMHRSPPERTWVGLTEEERSSFWTADYMTQKEWDRLFDSIEDKLKQKNTCTPPVATDPQAFYGFPDGPVSTPNAGGKCVTAGETAPPKEIDPNQWAFDNGLEST